MRAEVSVEQKKRRQYTPAERETVLGDVGELGILGAARKHGVAQSCVSRWASTARAARGSVELREPDPVEVEAAGDEPAVAPSASAMGGAPVVGDAPAVVEAPPVVEAPAGDVEPPVPAPTAAEGKVRSRAAKLYTPSQKAQVLEHAAAHGVTAAALKFEISRFSIYDWRRKLTKAALA